MAAPSANAASTEKGPQVTQSSADRIPTGTYTTEISNIVSLFLLPNSPKELNIPPTIRSRALEQLSLGGKGGGGGRGGTQQQQQQQQDQYDPVEALRPVAEHVYELLRDCSHRNFVRLGVGNGTFETVCVATLLGVANLLAGFALVLVRALACPGIGARPRREAWAAWPLWWLGLALVLSGLRGSCFFLLLFSRRQPLPWERFDDDDGGMVGPVSGGEKKGMGEGRGGTERGGGNTTEGEEGKKKSRRPVLALLRRSIGRLMIFDRRVKVQEKHLRLLQRKIVLQSLVGGAVFATLCALVFFWLPIWRESV